MSIIYTDRQLGDNDGVATASSSLEAIDHDRGTNCHHYYYYYHCPRITMSGRPAGQPATQSIFLGRLRCDKSRDADEFFRAMMMITVMLKA